LKGTGYKLIYIILGIALAVIYLSGSTIKSILSLKDEVSEHKEKLSSLKNQNAEIERNLTLIKSSDEYIKHFAKKKLGMVEPGEAKFYIVVREDRSGK
jgi:cell division protein FtsB